MKFKAHIEKLVGAANWSKWKRQIELLLRHHDVHDVVCGDRKCPSLSAEASAEAVATHEKEQKAFITGDSLAQLILTKKESKPKVDGDAFVCTVEGVPGSEVWINESGASAHMTNHKNYFVDFTQFNSPKPAYVRNSHAIMAYGLVTVNIEIRINNKWERHHLTEVWYVSDISRNLFSISQTLKKGFKFQASKDECSLLRDHRVCMKGVRTVQGLYALEMRVLHPKVSAEVFVTSADQSLQLWHERLCHQNKIHVRDLLSKYQIKSDVKDSKICDGCCYGKQCRRPFGTRKQRATTPGELINKDVCGPMQQQSLGGVKFYVCFKDDFTKYRRVFFMQSKSEVSALKRFLMKRKMLGIWSRRC
ncbi:retrovirus-related Pol polyprotein from transposon TNT 1-94 [Trichonephila clavipes]|nr:retrovirus-related Pol polyprotein from transposon TNT 1-94 [Trichonephila clavipes]